MITIGETTIDRESFLNVTSVVNGEDERIKIETTDITMYYDRNSRNNNIVQTKEMNRAFFDLLIANPNVYSIIIHFKSQCFLKRVEIIIDEVISKKTNKFNTLSYIVETNTDIHDINFIYVAFLQAKKRHI